MTDIHASLWEALGRPDPLAWLPPARALGWSLPAGRLQDAVRPHCPAARFRSWHALWRAARGTPAPSRATWGQLCEGVALGDLVARLAQRKDEGILKVASWNCQWLVDPASAAAAVKRAAIERLLLGGQLVMIQESHWGPADAAVWEPAFPGAGLAFTPARPGPAGGRQGGVAIFVPVTWTLTSWRTLVEGCAVEAVVVDPFGNLARTWCVYFPPGAQADVLQELNGLAAAEGVSAPDTILAGDLNFDFWNPRDSEERARAEEMAVLLDTLGAAPLPCGQATRRGRAADSSIDLLAAPVRAAWKWGVRTAWQRASDHAVLVSQPADASPPLRPGCTPQAFKSLPMEAIAALRRRFEIMRCVFAVPRAECAAVAVGGAGHSADPPWRPGEVGMDVGPDDPRLAIPDGPDRGGDRGQADSGGAGASGGGGLREVAWNASLARHGSQYLRSMVRDWWRRWSRRRTGGDPLEEELLGIVRGQPSQAYSPDLQQWLDEMGFTPGPADHRAATLWLMTYRRVRSSYRAERGPVVGFSPGVGRPAPSPRLRLGRRMYAEVHAQQGIRMPDGRVTHDPREMGEALWKSREHIWATAPDDLGSGRRVLEAYMDGRRVGLPERPPLQEATLRGAVLAPSGAAPGVDGIPYEVLQQGVQVIAHMIGNALIAAQWSPDRIGDIPGPPN